MVRILLDVLGGLGALHADVEDGVPFVHGEVSPQHIYIDDVGTARLVPLSGRHLGSGSQRLESGYTAPELLLGDDGDPRADLFSVGVILWEALAGTKLFPDPSVSAVSARLIEDRSPLAQRPTTDAGIKALCLIAEKTIALDPELRFQDTAELGDALRSALSSRLTESVSKKWLDEAPTSPKGHPKPVIPPFRTQTPPGTVLDLLPAPRLQPAATLPAASSSAALAVTLPAVSRRTEWLRASLVAAFSAAVAAAVGSVIPLRAAAPPPAPAGGRPLPKLTTSASAAPTVVVAPSASIPSASNPSASPSALLPAPPLSARRPVPHPVNRPKPRSIDSDYGI